MKHAFTKGLVCFALGTMFASNASSQDQGPEYTTPAGTPGKIYFSREGAYTDIAADCIFTIPSGDNYLGYDDSTGGHVLELQKLGGVTIGMNMTAVAKVIVSSEDPVEQTSATQHVYYSELPTQVDIAIEANAATDDRWDQTAWTYNPTNLDELAVKSMGRKFTGNKDVILNEVAFHLTDDFVDDDHVDTQTALTVTCYSD